MTQLRFNAIQWVLYGESKRGKELEATELIKDMTAPKTNNNKQKDMSMVANS